MDEEEGLEQEKVIFVEKEITDNCQRNMFGARQIRNCQF